MRREALVMGHEAIHWLREPVLGYESRSVRMLKRRIRAQSDEREYRGISHRLNQPGRS